MSRKTFGIAAGSVVAAGAIIAGGAAIANAASTPTPSSTSSGGRAPDGAGDGHGHGGQHTAATADQTAKVKAAVTAKDSAVTVTEVVKDADGSFDASGTKAGAPVRFDVSADYRTVTEAQGGPGGPGKFADTPVTGAEAAKVTAAVKAKDYAVTVTTVRKDPDGSYDVLGTKAAANVFYDVSKDLSTITLHTGGPGDHGGPGAPGGPAGANGTAVPSPSATS